MKHRFTFISRSGLEFLVCAVSFPLAAALTQGLDALLLYQQRLIVLVGCGICLWWRLQVEEDAEGVDLVEPLMIGFGTILMIWAFIGYSEFSIPLSVRALVAGMAISTVGCALVRHFVAGPKRARTLLVGCGDVGQEIVRRQSGRLVGVLAADARLVPPESRYLGDLDELGPALDTHQPARVVIDLPDWERQLPVQRLLDYKLAGGEITTAGSVYEGWFSKIYLPNFGMANVLRAETLRLNRRVMALQAVYSNLIGLALMLLFSPVLLIVGIVCRQAAGGGGYIFDRVECAGFQGIPFQRRRFKLRHRKTGKKTAAGRLVEWLGIVNLPQIVNLNRGEMGLLGPQPVRLAFSDYLGGAIPLHAYRLSIKPGILGWEQIHRSPGQPVISEQECIAYDLYYVEHGSPTLDIKIFLKAVWGFLPGKRAGR